MDKYIYLFKKKTIIVENFIRKFESTVKRCWDQPALGDFHKTDETYGELAARIATLQLVFEKAGLKRGDHYAINARSSRNWLEVFMGGISGGYVGVQMFNGFTPADTQSLVNHSDSRILFTEASIYKNMDLAKMPKVIGVIDCNTFECLDGRKNFKEIFDKRDALFAERYPRGLRPSDICYPGMDFKDTCAIMYTSGSTGNPKGVMISVENFSVNVEDLKDDFPYRTGENYLSILPFAHIFGLVCDGIIPLCLGMHEVVLGVPPIPANVKEAMCELQPRIFFAVPLILTKFIEYSIGKDIHSEEGAAKLADYENNREFCDYLRAKMIDALGGRIEEFVTGGAAIPSELESMLTEKLRLPFVTGYGMTETCPLIGIAPLGEYRLKSCGKVSRLCLDLKIDSEDSLSIPGEVLVKGPGVFSGYYKNPAATREAFTEDGWFRTGDIGTLDNDSTIFLVGRCKNMILGPNGQNIFPEEIEVILNNLPYVAESLVVSRGGKMTALIVPNADRLATDSIDTEGAKAIMKGNIRQLNTRIPAYSAVADFEIMSEAFSKTPKGSIRRFMYA